MPTVIIILISVLLNCTAQLLMKKGMLMVGEVVGGKQLFSILPSMITNGYLWLSAICYIFSFGFWLIVLSRVDVSYAYPFLSIGYVIAAIAGYYLFGDSVTPVRIAGILVICIGVILISRS